MALRPTSGSSVRLWGRAATVLGLVILNLFAGDFAYGLWQEQQLNERWHAQVASLPQPQPALPAEGQSQAQPLAPPALPDDHRAPIAPYPVDGVDFAIRVPKIEYYSAVQEGTDLKVLASGPGHYPTTAWPGQPGNVGVAAHNTYWIKFGDLRRGDEVVLETRWGLYRYRVTDTRIVEPDDRTVLRPSLDSRLTLTTCWPLWAGAFAQQRLAIFTVQTFPAQSPG